MQNAFDLPGHGGRLVMVGLVIGELTFDDPEFHRKELTLLASRNATGDDFRAIIQQIEENRIDIAAWITHTCPVEALPTELDAWLKPDAGLLKGMCRFD
jgi:threonine dehydrogenase-like Zn-dependent dehydrogenase